MEQQQNKHNRPVRCVGEERPTSDECTIVVHGATARNDQLWGQEIKVQGYTRLKIDLEAWQRQPSRPPCVE